MYALTPIRVSSQAPIADASKRDAPAPWDSHFRVFRSPPQFIVKILCLRCSLVTRAPTMFIPKNPCLLSQFVLLACVLSLSSRPSPTTSSLHCLFSQDLARCHEPVCRLAEHSSILNLQLCAFTKLPRTPLTFHLNNHRAHACSVPELPSSASGFRGRRHSLSTARVGLGGAKAGGASGRALC